MRRKSIAVLVLVLVAPVWVVVMDLTARSSAPTNRPATFTDDGTLRAEIARLDNDRFHLTLSVRVLGKDGETFGGLEAKDFNVTEDGRDVPLRKFLTAGQQPICVCLVLDHSGSMSSGGKMNGAKEAALAFLELLRDGRDQLGLIFFSKQVEEVLPVGLLDGDKRALARGGIIALEPKGNTQLYSAVEKALAAMEKASGRRVVVVLTDGIDDDGNVKQRDRILDRARTLDVPLYMIGLGEQKEIDEEAMEQFATGSRGRYLRTPRPDQLKKIYTDLGKALQNEYVLEYDSPHPIEDGRTRTVQVAVRHGGIGTKVETTYVTAGVFGAAGRTTASTGKDGTGERPPFWGVMLPLLAGLGLLFVVPYAVQMRKGNPTPSPATPVPARAVPPPPTAPPPAPPLVGDDVCPKCRRYRAPGAPGARFCMVCEQTY